MDKQDLALNNHQWLITIEKLKIDYLPMTVKGPISTLPGIGTHLWPPPYFDLHHL